LRLHFEPVGVIEVKFAVRRFESAVGAMVDPA
jgi:hypothetical protein